MRGILWEAFGAVSQVAHWTGVGAGFDFDGLKKIGLAGFQSGRGVDNLNLASPAFVLQHQPGGKRLRHVSLVDPACFEVRQDAGLAVVIRMLQMPDWYYLRV